MTQPVRIAVISGSLRKDSYNTRLARFVAGRIRGDGIEIDEISLAELDLPMMNEDLEKEKGHPDSVLNLKKRLIAADGVLYASPEYNGSLTGPLKNAIDWASRPRDDEKQLECFRGKVAGLLGASPGKLGGLRGIRDLRMILSGIGTHVVPDQFALSSAHEAFDEKGDIKDGNTAKMAIAVGESVVKTARALKNAG
ncbi:MAG: NAD(P)H-dependent oxidoreductase [Phycisphaerales bacterium]|nr:NAD(P)H-dependent oxidoreductase [Planctomycetota bacterium]MCH8509537.1 NAD(P)H-dependent oxidoreductase [Phycisphaerales bacterium]